MKTLGGKENDVPKSTLTSSRENKLCTKSFTMRLRENMRDKCSKILKMDGSIFRECFELFLHCKFNVVVK